MKINSNPLQWLTSEAPQPNPAVPAVAPSSPPHSAQSLPARPPQRRGSPAFVHAALHGASGSGSIHPDVQNTTESGRADFLLKTMQRPDLDAFASFLDEKIGKDWAITGSVAMQIHGHILNYQVAKERNPRDVDIIVDDSGLGLLEAALEDNNSQITSDNVKNAEVLKFENKLDVDVIASDGTRTFGDLHHEAQSIHGLRVMSLPALIKSKSAALDGYNGPFCPLSDLEKKAAILKAEEDMTILAALEVMQKTAVPPEFEQSYLAHSQPKPEGALQRAPNIFGGIG